MTSALLFTVHRDLWVYTHNTQARAITNVTVADGLWHHLCVAWLNTNNTVTVNLDAGKRYETVNVGFGKDVDIGKAFTAGGCITLGQHNAPKDRDCSTFLPAYSYEGYMSDFTLWNRVLTRSEVCSVVCGCGCVRLGDQLTVVSACNYRCRRCRSLACRQTLKAL